MRRWIVGALLFLILGATEAQPALEVPEPETRPAPPAEQEFWRARWRMYERKRRADARVERRRERREQSRRLLGRVLGRARAQVGVPYGFGAMAPGRAFDCSGFTSWVARIAGRLLPHSASAQLVAVRRVDRDELRPGDLIFYSYGRLGSGRADHVEMYAGNGRAVGTTSGGVAFQAVDWSNYLAAGRFLT
jgi:cell wall-associated NlpC family hydrolase